MLSDMMNIPVYLKSILDSTGEAVIRPGCEKIRGMQTLHCKESFLPSVQVNTKAYKVKNVTEPF